MAIQYNAYEIFQMGVEIEKNGKLFYDACARRTLHPEVKKLCGELAGWENQHVTLFQRLQDDLPESARSETFYDPDNELGMYLKAAADSHIFLANQDMSALASSLKTPRDILTMALSFEKDSVVLYTGMQRMVPREMGKASIEAITTEELKHISIITRLLASLGS